MSSDAIDKATTDVEINGFNTGIQRDDSVIIEFTSDGRAALQIVLSPAKLDEFIERLMETRVVLDSLRPA